MYLLTEDDREPVGWMNYARVDPKNILVHEPIETYEGELVWPVAVDMGGVKDRIGYSYIEPQPIIKEIR